MEGWEAEYVSHQSSQSLVLMKKVVSRRFHLSGWMGMDGRGQGRVRAAQGRAQFGEGHAADLRK